MSLSPHTLSNCCGVPVIGEISAETAVCSNCKEHCGVIYEDDGEREERGLNAIPEKPIDNSIRVLSFNRINQSIAVNTNFTRGKLNEIISKTDYINWGIKMGYISILTEIEYPEGHKWEKQPHALNTLENVVRKNNFYKSVNKKLLTEYLNHNRNQRETKKCETMSNPLNFVKLPDVVEADAVLQSITANADGSLSGTYQKVLIDDTTGDSENDGSPITFAIDQDDAADILTAIGSAIAANEQAIAAAKPAQ